MKKSLLIIIVFMTLSCKTMRDQEVRYTMIADSSIDKILTSRRCLQQEDLNLFKPAILIKNDRNNPPDIKVYFYYNKLLQDSSTCDGIYYYSMHIENTLVPYYGDGCDRYGVFVILNDSVIKFARYDSTNNEDKIKFIQNSFSIKFGEDQFNKYKRYLVSGLLKM